MTSSASRSAWSRLSARSCCACARPPSGCARRARGAVLVTRGPEPALFVSDDRALELIPPRFDRGSREGCGDAMMGALAAALATGRSWQDALVLGAAAGRRELPAPRAGHRRRRVVEELAGRVEVRPL